MLYASRAFSHPLSDEKTGSRRADGFLKAARSGLVTMDFQTGSSGFNYM